MWQAPEFIRGLGKAFRDQHDDDTRERLPERWIDLIRYLDAKERRETAHTRSKDVGALHRPPAPNVNQTDKREAH
jgi:hypothetical protein